MNENINLVKILKNCPKGFEFYSSVHGKLLYSYMYVCSSASRIYFTNPNQRSMVDGRPMTVEYVYDGRLYPLEGECTLFPSKEQRDWSKFTAPWYIKEKFDPKKLQPFDKVLVRDTKTTNWKCKFFSHISESANNYFVCTDSIWKHCIPYNDDTKHLVGTKNDAPEYYCYWEE